MMVIEAINQLEKRLNELEAKQKQIIEKFNLIGNLASVEYDTDKAQALHRQLQCTTAKKWGIIECLETLGYKFVYIDEKIKICNEFNEILVY